MNTYEHSDIGTHTPYKTIIMVTTFLKEEAVDGPLHDSGSSQQPATLPGALRLPNPSTAVVYSGSQDSEGLAHRSLWQVRY